ncbi:Splicing factor [Saxophila tyrrhenica]|uniref:U4/U6 snRNA-associated-splicing factor PRP24 n=1 Tax=Saxophila tyrrhenica TaxID=1690608 RepID=A0AAV9P1C5_9PEZI|nr:Splicing factor [Saxophila tyrrhenica]
MNINSLLSPSESPATPEEPPSNPPPRARPAGGKRTTSGLSQEVRRSPEGATSTPSSRPSSAYDSPSKNQRAFPRQSAPVPAAPGFRPAARATPTSNPAPAQDSPSYHGHSSSQQRPVVAHRVSSTPQMETLADLASMQNRHQATRASSLNGIPRSTTKQDSRSPSLINPNQGGRPAPFRNSSGQSLADITMAEAPSSTPPPRTFESAALSETESATVTELLQHLNENSWAYDSHVQLIALLHKGFLAHVYPPADSNGTTPRDPKAYSFLTELRQAREAMKSRFALGEDLWVEWLSDEMLLASSWEERTTLTELFEKAVESEPASVKLWRMWVDYVSSNYADCNNLDGADQSGWTEEDKEVCRELFTRDMMLGILEKGQAATQWRMDESQLLWDPFAQLVQESFPDTAAPKDVDQLFTLFVQRLQTPHIVWEDTAQAFWPLVSRHRSNDWESVMRDVTELAGPAKRAMGLREEQELNLRRAVEGDNRMEAFNAFAQYLELEKKISKKPKQQGPFDGHLRCAVYERALLRFPTYVDWWLDYVDYIITAKAPTSVVALIERAVNHCPWSGDLWARWILQSDVEGMSREDIEKIKHRATNSGLLDIGGMEELVKVLIQWCSYLRRHAFRPNCSEDDLDTAEVGITMALEDIQQAGTRIYGKDFHGDPLYRLERIQIKFLSEARRFEDARGIYRALADKQKNVAEFWLTYYNWELWLWGFDRMADKHRVETANNGPDKATAVAQQALSQRSLDEPEKILSTYLNHFQQHESGEKLRAALVQSREFSRGLAIRRAKEAEEAAAQPAVYQAPATDAANASAVQGREKRKREDDALTNGTSDKKAKITNGEEPASGFGEPSGSASAQVKRDRENNTITVKNLPADVQELDVRKFFKDVGTIVSVTWLEDRATTTAMAIVEFESHEDVLAAKTRNGRDLNGSEVRIQGGSQSTLYVTNYPPEYDEAAIRKLFASYGEIISVRLPSLKYENRRRFCYVQFLTTEMAKAAEAAMDNKMLDGSHKLLAKISDPDAKKQRSGAQAEGRELFVKNLHREASDDDIKTFFEQYGSVVHMNMVKLVNGKRTGTGFIVFSSTTEANAALEADNKPFRDRILHVELSSAKGRADPRERARKEDVIIKQGGASLSPEPADAANGRRGSDVSMASAQQDDAWKTAKERKIAVLNLPDTVNDARVRAAMEAYGPLVKIQMRRGDAGAIVEFANVKDAFHVRQGVDCASLGDGVRTGDVGDLLAKVRKRQAAEGKEGAGVVGGKVSKDGFGGMAPAGVARPGQRGGRRGGLGFKRGAGFGAGKSGGGGEAEGVEKVGAKSNADFRSMFVKGKEAVE